MFNIITGNLAFVKCWALFGDGNEIISYDYVHTYTVMVLWNVFITSGSKVAC